MVPEPATPGGRVGDLVDVVDQDVELAVVGANTIEERGDLRIVAVVGLHRDAVATRFVDECGRSVDRQFTRSRCCDP